MLFFDTETTGLPISWNAPVSHVKNWPRMVQLAWVQYDEKRNVIGEANHIIKPEGFTIPRDASAIHGITNEYAIEHGSDLSSVLSGFSSAIDGARVLIAHNMDFDEKIVGAEFYRLNIESNLFNTQRFCTMKSTTNLCKIPGAYGFKWPKLSELHRYLFGADFKEAHDASVDVAICARCFFELVDRGNIVLNDV